MVSFIHDKLRICFVDVPLACSSVINTLFFDKDRAERLLQFSELNEGLPIHASITQLADRLGGQFQDYFSFAYYRDPFDYLFCLYNFLAKRPNHADYGLVQDKTFADFLQSADPQSVRLQSRFICDENGVAVSRLEPFQAFQSTFKDILGELGISSEGLTQYPRKDRSYLKAYTQDMISHVNDVFADEIALLGTPFPPRPAFRKEVIVPKS